MNVAIMKKFERIVLLISFLLCGNLMCFAQESSTKYQGKVISIADGNTLTILTDNKKLRVRLLGIDAPTQAFSKESRENLAKLLDGKSVVFSAVPLEFTAGKEKILVGKVFVDNVDVALSQITDGFAWQTCEEEKYVYVTDKQTYAEAEQRAKDSKRGIWSDSFKPCKDATVKTSVGTSAKSNSEKTKRPKVFCSVTAELVIDESGNVVSA
ncbi:MAG: thermonuclease family protein, partial [Pyrinomonadaceae bacterium]